MIILNLQVHREEMLIFMEYCPEGSLEELVSNTEAGLEETLIRRYTRQLLEAVVCLHEHGVVHRFAVAVHAVTNCKGHETI